MTPKDHEEPRWRVFGWNDAELGDGETLHDVWASVGFAVYSGDHPTPIPWQELWAYATMSGEVLSGFEWRVVREMSEAYCSELSNTSPFAKPPVERAGDD